MEMRRAATDDGRGHRGPTNIAAAMVVAVTR